MIWFIAAHSLYYILTVKVQSFCAFATCMDEDMNSKGGNQKRTIDNDYKSPQYGESKT